jgi:enterochelin esterase family protein
MARLLALVTLLAASITAFAQQPSTHQVNPDGSITFRYTDRSAAKVTLTTDAFPKPLTLTRDDNGVWSVTTSALPPETYGYTFVVDGTPKLDPTNSDVRPNYVSLSNNVTVPATPPASWELTAIPHGRVDHHLYTTHVVKNLPENQNAYVVYTPPGYDPRHKGGYPVLYLLHGWSDNETGWTAVGHADLILDSLIDSGKAVPMIVVMPLGYGDLAFVNSGSNVWNDPAKVDENVALYTQALETEVIPAVEHEYNVAAGRNNHAIAGLSMGGLESLSIGLTHTDQFAYVAGLSSAIHGEHFDEHFPGLDAKRANLSLLWVACGTTDRLITPNRDFISWAKTKGFDVTAVETPGAHSWLTWRDNLNHLAPLLFRAK